jgi:DNA-binding NarL/FixJ family response regulator
MALLRQYKLSNRGVTALVLTPRVGKREVLELLDLGVRGVVEEDASPGDLLQGMRTVTAGRYWLHGRELADLEQARLYVVSGERTKRAHNDFDLTARELDIVEAVLRGWSNQRVARKLSISRETVKHHLTNIFDKVGVFNRLELALFAVHHRLGARRTSATADIGPPRNTRSR